MTVDEKRKIVKRLFKGYKKMTHDLEHSLREMGIQVEYSKKHIKLFYNGKLLICPSSASDSRSGINLATIICHEI